MAALISTLITPISRYNKNHIIAIWFVVVELLDVLSTRVGVVLGATEMNPVLTILHLSLMQFLLIKVVVVLILAYRIFTKGLPKWMTWVIFSVMGIVVLLNAARIVTLIFFPQMDALLFIS
jgi:hypothetical protein